MPIHVSVIHVRCEFLPYQDKRYPWTKNLG